MKSVLVCITFLCCLIYIQNARGGKDPMALTVESAAFTYNEIIPSMYTCDGDDVSPPLSWSAGPEGTQSYVLISDDPDAPIGTWVHWVLFDIPPEVTELTEGISPSAVLANGAKHGMNDFRKLGYGGPCPPSGTHRYYFKVYALDTMLNLTPGASKRDVEKSINGHVLASGELIGLYQRQR